MSFAEVPAAPAKTEISTPAPANTPAADSKANGIDIINSLFVVLSFIMTPLIMLAGWLMDPTWTMGDAFNMR